MCVVRMHACTCVYLSLDLFLRAVCLSPPDCNPAVLGSMFCNLSLTVGVCVHHEFVFFVCQCCVIYRHLTTVGRFGTIQRFHPTPMPVLNCAPEHRSRVHCQRKQTANKSRAEGIGLHLQQRVSCYKFIPVTNTLVQVDTSRK